ncbi:MAG TPA: tRNA 2-thiouridine(34) synthase MnmA [Candidatus Gracilibacteria bacterium]|nr:tRNA 2-thiouridine(34) synthase MnmA [Candidatus Gracilibacteria bacterium]
MSRVLLAMSGGVDSSVAALLLQEAGHEVIGIYMNLWRDEELISPENYEKIRSRLQVLREKLKIEILEMDYQEYFKETVVQYFLDSHRAHLTPNPCIFCNRQIKFGLLQRERVRLNCDYLSTGHYAQIKKRSNGDLALFPGEYLAKDQSYFLYNLQASDLATVYFPLGGMTKPEVREKALAAGWVDINSQKESQGVCFLGGKSYLLFLERYAPELFVPGNIILNDEIVGRHQGLVRYTIGQRRGVEVGGQGDPVYVSGFDLEKNQLIVARDEQVFCSKVNLKNWILTGSEIGKWEKGVEDMIFMGRLRHLGYLNPVKIQIISDQEVELNFQVPVRAITSGQSVVLYREDGSVFGGGEII